MKKPKILLTGGLGYIGSHTCIVLEQAGIDTVLLDNLSNSSIHALTGIENILGYRPIFFEADIRNSEQIHTILANNHFDGVIHFAGLKSVGESVAHPFEYYDNNIRGSFVFFEEMEKAGLRNIVFSSSATVYSQDNQLPLVESSTLGTTNAYGTSKLALEFVLRDLSSAKNWNVFALRYFNPIGAHPSGLIGERPNGVPNNLLPYVLEVAVGKRTEVSVYGNDYPTPDGTGVRDYIDVNDLAGAHLLAIRKLLESRGGKFSAINIGTGRGTSVLEIINLVGQSSGNTIPYVICDRRPGDLASVYTDPSLALSILGWKAQHSIGDSVANSWKFVSKEMK